MIGGLIVRQQRTTLAEAVQIFQVTGRVQQPLPVVLAVDVQQLPSQLSQLCQGHGATVQTAGVLPVRPQLPLEQQDALGVRGDALLLEPIQLGQVHELGADQGGFGAGADEVTGGASTQDGVQGVHYDGFACAGLAGKDVEARVELDVGGLDDRDVFNVKQ